MPQFPCMWLAFGPTPGTCHCSTHEYDLAWIEWLNLEWPAIDQCLMCCQLDEVAPVPTFGPDDNRIGAWL